jgi:anti-anti-sigma factor
VDIASCRDLEERLIRCVESGFTRVELTFDRDSFLDSSGVLVLLRTARRLESRGGRLYLSSQSRQLRRLVSILRLQSALPLEEEPEPPE